MAHLLTEKQLRDIAQIISDVFAALTVLVLGPDFVDDAEIDRLVGLGLVDPEAAYNYPEMAYLFGRIVDAVGEDEIRGMKWDEFTRFLETDTPSMSLSHRSAVRQAKRQTYKHIKGLGDKAESTVDQLILEADQRMQHRIEQGLREHIVSSVERGTTAKEVAQELEKTYGQMQRDWHMVAVSETNNAITAGRADAISKKSERGKDARVYKLPRPDACEYCKALYLGNDKKTPRVFSLREMRAFGTNIGLTKKQWKPVIGSVHPWCRCTLHELPPGFGFDEFGRLVFIEGIGPGTLRPDVTSI